MANPIRTAAKRVRSAEAKAGDVTLMDDRGWRIITGKGSSPAPVAGFEELAEKGFLSNPVVAACTREIVTSLSEAPIRAYEHDKDDNPVLLPRHPADALFAQPNPRDSRVEFIERVGVHYLLGGNTVWVKVRETGRITRRIRMLKPIPPNRILGAGVDGDGFPVYFNILLDPEDARPKRVPAEDVVHIPDIHPLNEVFGAPRLSAAGRDIGTDNEASKYTAEVLQNHGSPGLVVGVSTAAEPDQIRRAEAAWEERFGSGRGRGKVGFVSGMEAVKEIGFSLKDLEFEALRGITREGICAAIGPVDPRLIGIGSATKGTSLGGTEFREARTKLWTQCIIPLIRRFESALNADVAPEFGENVYLHFDLSEVEALQESRTEAVKRSILMTKGPFTDAEIRVEAGFDPDYEEEDEEEDDGQDGGSASPEGGDDGEDDGPDAEEDDDGKTATKAAAQAGGFPQVLVPEGGLTDEEKEARWKQFDSFATSQEPQYYDAARERFDTEEADIIGLMAETLQDDGKGGEGPEARPFRPTYPP